MIKIIEEHVPGPDLPHEALGIGLITTLSRTGALMHLVDEAVAVMTRLNRDAARLQCASISHDDGHNRILVSWDILEWLPRVNSHRHRAQAGAITSRALEYGQRGYCSGGLQSTWTISEITIAELPKELAMCCLIHRPRRPAGLVLSGPGTVASSCGEGIWRPRIGVTARAHIRLIDIR